MQIAQRYWTSDTGWHHLSKIEITGPQLVFVFGGRSLLHDSARIAEIRTFYPDAHYLFCSTAGEIIERRVLDNSLAVTAVKFEHTTLAFAKVDIADSSQSEAAGKTLAEGISHDGLKHALVFSEGVKINGTSLVRGLTAHLPPDVSVTGGLVGDGADFKETLVGLDEEPTSGRIVLIGLYGDKLNIGYGSLGGWDTFGPERIVTKSKENVLYELDGRQALALYKEYLGDKAKDLPGSGLLFPLKLTTQTEKGTVEVVRTLLAVDETAQSMTFAGDLPEGAKVQLMKANFERLIDGAGGAAGMSVEPLGQNKPDLALLISCVGRKLVLGERIEEEIEAVSKRIDGGVAITGFYSYGEICPTAATEKQCQLHNQTMTITTFREEA